jgi:alkyl sulfatase BDS1-like metallo-beta-lactamase superfamily hydrolase
MISAYNMMLSGLTDTTTVGTTTYIYNGGAAVASGTTTNPDGSITDGMPLQQLIYVHGSAVIGNTQVKQALTDQLNAVQYVESTIVAGINAMEPLDQIVAGAQLPASLASSPYLQQVETDLASAIRGAYGYYIGWFHGDPVELASTLTPAVKAQTIAGVAGGVGNLILQATQAELAAQDLPSAEKALLLAQVAYNAGSAPLADQAKAVYIQALTKCAYMQKSSQVRYYYLTIARGLGANF